MHLAIDRDDVVLRSIAGIVQHRRRVVIQPRRAPLKQARNHHQLVLANDLAQRFCGRPGNRLRDIEQRMVLALAEVLSSK